MEKTIRGKVFVLGDNVDTDQIIPAEYLSYNPADPAERKFFGRYALSGVPIAQSGLPASGVPFVTPESFRSAFSVIVAGRNFGCGSSREHAPLALSEAGCRVVIAESFARIFYRNSINGGYLVPLETPEPLIEVLATGHEVHLDVQAGVLEDLTDERRYGLNPLGDVDAIVQAGGLFAYARKTGLWKESPSAGGAG